jgi:hypothetical protein
VAACAATATIVGGTGTGFDVVRPTTAPNHPAEDVAVAPAAAAVETGKEGEDDDDEAVAADDDDADDADEEEAEVEEEEAADVAVTAPLLPLPLG